MLYRTAIFSVIGIILVVSSRFAYSHPADENPDLTLPGTTREFRQDRFGMFIHWGLYSVLCDGETVMQDRELSPVEYELTARFFNPSQFDPAHWVEIAKAAGVKYITFTCRYHDGFAMWNSNTTAWNVMKSTPFARDVVKELTETCQREGIKLFIYYSPQGWRYFQPGNGQPATASSLAAQDSSSSSTFALAKAHLGELLGTYGKINGVWLDGLTEQPGSEGGLQDLYNHIRRYQPATLIGNNHGQNPQQNEDFQIRDRGALDQTIEAAELGYTGVPIEINDTINRSRGFNLTDNQFKSPRELVHSLVRAAGMDANYVLSVGPMPDGQIPQEQSDRLRRVGMWLAKHGESIYATRGGPTAPKPWGVTTHRRHKVYVHVLDPETTSVELQLPSRVRSARYFPDESDADFESTETTVSISLRPERRGEMERLVVLETMRYQ